MTETQTDAPVVIVDIKPEPKSTPESPLPGAEASATDEVQEPCGDQPLATRIEVLLMSTDKAVPEARLAALLGIDKKGGTKRVSAAIDELNDHYEQTGRSFRAEKLAGGWQLMTTAQFGTLLERMHAERQQTRLSQAAMETLAIVAYRQPIMRAEIEAIRGVASGEVLRGLLERRLVKIVGRAEELGRPMLYGTTREFLNVFGLAGPDDLPTVEGLEAPRARPSIKKAKPIAETTEQDEAVAEEAVVEDAVAEEAAPTESGDETPTTESESVEDTISQDVEDSANQDVEASESDSTATSEEDRPDAE